MNLKRINAYTIYANPPKKYFWLRLRLDNHEPNVIDIECSSMIEIYTMVDLLRNESNIMFDLDNQDVVIGWEPTGENAPNQTKV